MTPQQLKAMKLALDALELAHPRFGIATEKYKQAITALKERLADPMREVQKIGQEIEPDDIASILACRDMLDAQPVPPRTWVGLTDEDISEIVRGTHNTGSFVRAIEAKLKEKNCL